MKIVGKNWELWPEEDAPFWHFEGEPPEIFDMVLTEFPEERLYQEYFGRHYVQWGTQYGPLFEDVLRMFETWGIKAEGVDLPKRTGESGVYD